MLHIVTGDKTWVQHAISEIKRTTMAWKHSLSPSQNFKTMPSATKGVATVFLDHQYVLLVDLLTRGATVNATSHTLTLDRLRDAIRRKRPGLLAKGVFFSRQRPTA